MGARLGWSGRRLSVAARLRSIPQIIQARVMPAPTKAALVPSMISITISALLLDGGPAYFYPTTPIADVGAKVDRLRKNRFMSSYRRAVNLVRRLYD